jgi:hypothetical protein
LQSLQKTTLKALYLLEGDLQKMAMLRREYVFRLFPACICGVTVWSA